MRNIAFTLTMLVGLIGSAQATEGNAEAGKTKSATCAACHGANGEGLPKRFPRLSGQHADYTAQQLKIFRTAERANAPMMQVIATKMTDAEMQAVADYIQGLR